MLQYSLILSCFWVLGLATNADYGFVLFKDIRNHLQEYYDFAISGTVRIPDELQSYYMQARLYSDDSFSTIFINFPVDKVSSAVAQLPWYSERLYSELSVALTQDTNSTYTYQSNPELTTSSISLIEHLTLVGVPSYAYNKSRSTFQTPTTSSHVSTIDVSSSVYTDCGELLFVSGISLLPTFFGLALLLF